MKNIKILQLDRMTIVKND